ncbi:hypothetical protein HOC01_04550 [archaeon]|nr:hypothetical protein [archaeon]
MSTINTIQKSVLKSISPTSTRSKEVQDIISKIQKKLQTQIKKQKLQAEAFIGGSIAKGTYFANKTDVDIFIRFDYITYKTKSNQLSDLLEPILTAAFPLLAKKNKLHRVHGSRDYFQINMQGFQFEFVPILNITDAKDAINITDVTPLHVDYVNKSANKQLKDQIRLAKQFAKANNCYGAESYIGGFSGYVLEILTIHYSSFEALLKASQKWKLNSHPNEKKTVIDPSNYHKGKMISFEIDVSKLQSPIVVVDPTDKWRNASAALIMQKVKLFQKAAKQYLTSPNKSFFEKQPVTVKNLKQIAKKSKLNLTYLELIPNLGKQDVVGCQILKTFEFIKKELKEFTLKQANWDWQRQENSDGQENSGKAILYYFTKKSKLPKTFKIQGPPTTMSAACKAFKKAHKNTTTVQGKLVATENYKQTDLELVLLAILKKSYLKQKFQQLSKTELTLN